MKYDIAMPYSYSCYQYYQFEYLYINGYQVYQPKSTLRPRSSVIRTYNTDSLSQQQFASQCKGSCKYHHDHHAAIAPARRYNSYHSDPSPLLRDKNSSKTTRIDLDIQRDIQNQQILRRNHGTHRDSPSRCTSQKRVRFKEDAVMYCPLS